MVGPSVFGHPTFDESASVTVRTRAALRNQPTHPDTMHMALILVLVLVTIATQCRAETEADETIARIVASLDPDTTNPLLTLISSVQARRECIHYEYSPIADGEMPSRVEWPDGDSVAFDSVFEWFIKITDMGALDPSKAELVEKLGMDMYIAANVWIAACISRTYGPLTEPRIGVAKDALLCES